MAFHRIGASFWFHNLKFKPSLATSDQSYVRRQGITIKPIRIFCRCKKCTKIDKWNASSADTYLFADVQLGIATNRDRNSNLFLMTIDNHRNEGKTRQPSNQRHDRQIKRNWVEHLNNLIEYDFWAFAPANPIHSINFDQISDFDAWCAGLRMRKN